MTFQCIESISPKAEGTFLTAIRCMGNKAGIISNIYEIICKIK